MTPFLVLLGAVLAASPDTGYVSGPDGVRLYYERIGSGPKVLIVRPPPANLKRHFAHSFTAVQKLDVPREAITKVRVPVLTIHGTWDRNAPYAAGREWAMTLPDARLLTVEGAAHQVTADAPDIVIPAIDTFVRGDWPAGAERISALERSATP